MLTSAALIAGLAASQASALRVPSPASTATVVQAEEAYVESLLSQTEGRYDSALWEIEKALKEDGTSPYLARQAAALALGLGRVDEAKRWALQATLLNPKEANSFILLGRAQWAENQLGEAQASFRKALRIDPDSPEATFALANVIAPQDPAQAARLLKDFLGHNPEDALEAELALAQLDLNEHNPAAAIKHLEAAIKTDPGEPSLPARFALAQLYETRASTEAALSQFLAIDALQPRNVRLIDHIGQLEILLGRWDQAKSFFDTAHALAPADPTANLWLSRYAEKDGDLAKAASYLEAGAVSDPSISLRAAFLLDRLDHRRKALDILQKAADLWPKSPRVQYALATALSQSGNPGRALGILKALVKSQPNNWKFLYALSVLAEETGDIALAEKGFRSLIAHNPKDASLLNYLGYSLAVRGLKLPEDEILVKKALNIDPNNGAYQDSLGWIYYKEGRWPEALSELEIAAKSLPSDDTVLGHLGQAAAKTGRWELSFSSWKRAASLEAPGTRDRKAALKAARKAARRIPKNRLALLDLESLREVQGGIVRLSGLCGVSGRVFSHPFSFQALFNYASSSDTLTIELLGPLFTPVLSMSLSGRGVFAMDPIQIPGIPPDRLESSLKIVLSSVRSYFAGAYFEGADAQISHWWFFGTSLKTPRWTMRLSRDGLLSYKISPRRGGGPSLFLSQFALVSNKLVPTRLSLSLPGARFLLTLSSFHLVTKN